MVNAKEPLVALLETYGFHFYRATSKWIARGVTYGPFRPGESGKPYPSEERLRQDFAAMEAAGVNTIRLYEFPDENLVSIAAEYQLSLLLDIPWPKHLDVYNNPERQAMCLRMMEERLLKIREWPNVFGILLGNEIPPDLIRWAGTGQVLRFLRRLYDRAKQLAPDLPIGYANFPSTEFLRPNFFDFIGFNVYLNDPEVFRKYLIRLRLLYPEKPLLLSEVGMDTQQNSETEQAYILERYLQIAYEVGMAGAFVFSWTDEWHTGGFDINDWSFGLVDKARKAKPALDVVSRVFHMAPQCERSDRWPKVSVVVASYNGGRTLAKCLHSLMHLAYPDYEVIVVDDGSTDNTSEILPDFRDIKVIRQPNQGLSAARNAGIQMAEGEVVAFTDSDCVADSDWLHHLISAMNKGDYAGMGGPNLTPPESGPIARSIALAPGHATHVLLNEQDAEHVPGCNMAFRRDALLEIGGFNPIYRKAGDDVDVIWRLQDSGHRIGFSTAAFVWHHRRPTLRSYLRQQIGYGEAEAILLWKHPHRFNDRGQSIWRGIIYSNQECSATIRGPNIQYGVFGMASFQCIYDRPASLFNYLLTSVEWWFASLALTACGIFSASAARVGFAGILAAVALSGARAWRKWSSDQRYPARYLPIVWLLWTLQPIYRGGARYWFRWRPKNPSTGFRGMWQGFEASGGIAPIRRRILQYWSEEAPSRVEALQKIMRSMLDLNWLHSTNTGWEPWDLSVVLSWWFKARVVSAEENHGQQKRLLRLRLSLAPTSLFFLAMATGLVLGGAVAVRDTYWARLVLIGLLVFLWLTYRQARQAQFLVAGLIEKSIKELGLIALDERGRPVDPLPREDQLLVPLAEQYVNTK